MLMVERWQGWKEGTRCRAIEIGGGGGDVKTAGGREVAAKAFDNGEAMAAIVNRVRVVPS